MTTHTSSTDPAPRQHCVVQGACGGIGLALTALLLESSDTHISATCRHSQPCPRLAQLQAQYTARLTLAHMDITDPGSIRQGWETISATGLPVDALVNLSGLLHNSRLAPEKRLEQLDPQAMLRLFAVNATGPLLVIQQGLSHFAKHQRVVIASLSARVGSIGDNSLGGWYSYRASKAALNMLNKTCAIELKRRLPQAICVVLHPGTVNTMLSRPFQRNVSDDALQSPHTAATHILNHLNSLQPSDSGGFFAWDGKIIDW